MDLFSLAARLSLDTSDYTNGINKAEGKLSQLGDKAKKAGAFMFGTLTAAAGAVGGISMKAVEAYKDYEQLVGGMQKLFGSSADQVIENANKAYETAGMSANDYMETVSSFASALTKSTSRGEQTNLEELKKTLDDEYTATKRNLQDQYDERKRYWDERISLTKNKKTKQILQKQRDEELKDLKRSNEDTLAELKKHNKEALAEAERANQSGENSEESLNRAAKLADMAIADMSDNANTFGTDMSSIQNAYAGFAKGNYTMLDNLKLGFGGTKEGMEQLLAEAEKLTGRKYDISNYADIVEAIHAIQTEMKISGLSYEEAMEKYERGELTWEQALDSMGTTAREASTTIEGSLNMTKAAWQNMLVALADKNGDTKKATQNLVRAAKTVYKNISPVIMQSISSIGDFLSEIAPIIGEELPKIIVDIAPKLFDAGKKLIKGLAEGVLKAIKSIDWPSWDDIKLAVTNAWDRIVEAVSDLGGLIFGRDSEGKVNWPTWDDVKQAATDLWDKIKGLAGDFMGLVFGKKGDGTVNYPVWDDGAGGGVKGAIEGAWNTIVAEASKLTGIEFGNISSVGELLTQIKDKWEELRKKVEEKAIAIGTYFFGEGKEKEVTEAIKTLLDCLVAFGTGLIAYKAITGITSLVETVKGLLSFNGTSKTALIIAGLATAFMLIVQNWDTIKEKLGEVWEWLDTNIITPIGDFFRRVSEWVDNAIFNIKKLLGLAKGEKGVLFGEYASNIGKVYQTDVRDEASQQKWLKDFKGSLEDAGFAAEEVKAIIDAIDNSDPTNSDARKWVENLVTGLSDADTKAELLSQDLFGLPDDLYVTVHVVADDPDDLLSGGWFSGGRGGGGGNIKALAKAKGDWNVPYDNFLANLHRGEMVLTASQARRYRDGDVGGRISTDFENRVIAAIREGMAGAQVEAVVTDREIAKGTNRYNGKEIDSGRFLP